MSRTPWRTGAVIIAFTIGLMVATSSAEAKDTALTFDKIVILHGGGLTEPVEITDRADLAGSALDSIRPSVPSDDDLGTPYQLLLYPQGSDEPMQVTYYAAQRGKRGFIYQPEPFHIGGGTLGPGWNRPSRPLEAALRAYGAVNGSAHSRGVPGWPFVAAAVAVAGVLLPTGALAWWRTRRVAYRGAH